MSNLSISYSVKRLQDIKFSTLTLHKKIMYQTCGKAYSKFENYKTAKSRGKMHIRQFNANIYLRYGGEVDVNAKMHCFVFRAFIFFLRSENLSTIGRFVLCAVRRSMNIVVTTFHLATALDCYLVCFSPSILPPRVTVMEVIKHYRRHCSKDH